MFGIESIFARIEDSVVLYGDMQEKRIAAGMQPELRFTDFTSISIAIATYLSITFFLYQFMLKREKGFSLKPLLVVYNAICVMLAFYVCFGIAKHWVNNGVHSFVCNKEDYSHTGLELAFVFWCFYAQKFFEFFDTWFFILRRSFRQVSFLHIFHHASIVLVVGLILPRAYSGDIYLPIFLNSFVHVCMYSHYLVSCLGHTTWWKPYLTSMQLIQFVLISCQNLYAWYKGPTCGGPDYSKALLIVYMGSMLFLFGNFFLQELCTAFRYE
mmetsp:Transcript_17300/g.27002  ORF Transcript_17300/g.27002 Transcript_17300/m.27002 type:complete len:269 (-) Transcript_17300:60-866(-)